MIKIDGNPLPVCPCIVAIEVIPFFGHASSLVIIGLRHSVYLCRFTLHNRVSRSLKENTSVSDGESVIVQILFIVRRKGSPRFADDTIWLELPKC